MERLPNARSRSFFSLKALYALKALFALKALYELKALFFLRVPLFLRQAGSGRFSSGLESAAGAEGLVGKLLWNWD